MKKTIMSNLPTKSHIYTDPNHDLNSDYKAAGSGKQTPFEGSKDLLVDEEWSTVKKEGFLGEKAEQYIRDSANIEGLPGDDDDDLDDEEDDEIDLDEELEIETDEVDVESIEIDDEDPDDLLEDDDDLDDDDDIL